MKVLSQQSMTTSKESRHDDISFDLNPVESENYIKCRFYVNNINNGKRKY